MQDTVSEKISSFIGSVAYERLLPEIVEKTKSCLLNGIVMGIAARDAEYARVARSVVKAQEKGVDP